MNHLAEYLATTNATQRTKVITAAKFPKKIEVASYGQIRKPLRDALTKDDFGRDDLEFLAGRLEAKAEEESGWSRDEAMRCLRAVRAFQASFNPKSFSKLSLAASPKGLFVQVADVKVNIALDAMVTGVKGDETYSGGLVLLYGFSADRGDIKDRLSATSGLILWGLESSSQMKPLPRLCMTVDLAQQDIVKASGSFARFRGRVEESCKEVSARWGSIAPPHDYDGPDWC